MAQIFLFQTLRRRAQKSPSPELQRTGWATRAGNTHGHFGPSAEILPSPSERIDITPPLAPQVPAVVSEAQVVPTVLGDRERSRALKQEIDIDLRNITAQLRGVNRCLRRLRVRMREL